MNKDTIYPHHFTMNHETAKEFCSDGEYVIVKDSGTFATVKHKSLIDKDE